MTRPSYLKMKRIARDELKNIVLSRDEYVCQSCHQNKSWEELTLHHKKGWEEGEFDQENMVTLCRQCHDVVHGIVRDSKGKIIKYKDKQGIEVELR